MRFSKLKFFLILPLTVLLMVQSAVAQKKLNLLVFSKTAAFRHASIEAGQTALKKMAGEKGFTVSFTEDASLFTESNLKNYNAVVFLNTTGDILNDKQQATFERYIQAGGGYVGVHAATDTEYQWPWYNRLAGAWFQDHPMTPSNVQKGRYYVTEKNALTAGMPDSFERTDEFYAFKNISDKINVVLKIDESSYIGGTNGDNHPMSWYQEFDGGRSFYTSMGHTDETYSEPLFLNHLYAGIKYATGGDSPKGIDFSKARPEENRFTKVVLKDKLDEPMELTLLDKDRVLFIQRKGEVRLYNNQTKELKTIANIPVSKMYVSAEGKEAVAEDGLLGLNKDPNFTKNNWIYMYYSSTKGSYNVLSRFTMKGDELLIDSEKEMLKIPTQREECCHTGGSIAWDKAGNLFLSTGDNTNPHGSNGYSPSDERPGKSAWDAQKSSANTNDLRGKIIRITPQADGTYTIPEGNLFAKGTAKTRPEIYTMGHRNPFRISVDKHTGFVYWGEVGPDANDPQEGRGPAGHDEIGQARKAGNFGWPHFVGNNKAYNKYDFANEKSLEKWDAAAPTNTSPNNTGLEILPPAKDAFVWYPYGESPEFPLVGTGGRNAMAGPVFYSEDFKGAERAFPKYYDGKFLEYEWMRGWIMAVTMDKEGNLKSMERFMPSYKFSNPMDMVFADNGDLYMLEYGSGWFTGNDDARLIRIEYNGGNRQPQIQMTANQLGGAAPFNLELSSDGTVDADGDALTYNWTITGNNFATAVNSQNAKLTLKEIGIYQVKLTVKDGKGGTNSQSMEVTVGNEPPVVSLEMPNSNKSFFVANRTFDYDIKVTDKEDGSLANGIEPDQVAVSIDYLAEGFDKVDIARGHRSADASAAFAKGRKLIEGSDCMACHSKNKKSIGPSYTDVANKYKGDKAALETLTKKVISGGSGVWGETAMAGHPSLSTEDASEMVKYILNIANEKPSAKTLPVKGTFAAKVPAADKGQSVYIVRASYEDQGAMGMPSLRSEQSFVLRNSKLGPHDFDVYEDINKMAFGGNKLAIPSKNGSYMVLKQVDLSGIKAIEFAATAPKPQLNASGGRVQIRLGSAKGKLIGQTEFLEPSEAMSFEPKFITANINLPEGTADNLQDLYAVFVNPDAGSQSMMVVMGIEFKMLAEGEVIQAPKSNHADFFVGKWNTLFVGTPQGDVKLLLDIARKDGNLVGSITPDMPDAETVQLDKIEETEEAITIYFNMMNYDLNVTLSKEGDNNLSGKLMNMIDVTSERVIAKADFFAGNWKTTFIGTPQGDAELVLSLKRKDGELTGTITSAEAGSEAVTLDKVEETEDSVTIYFNMMNYDLNVVLKKEDEQNLKGSLMGMFDVTAEKMK
ncbi:ThuA domain-containing protein [Arcticibacterium luteifluviistationis]|uniref:Cytochrome C n=1 Tax=Arcticibacterium luteifluviistationis TaxID=1784714 RepID=A0A2Z4GBF3_9BACT|nr:ThuA domain-containing protein [Arcticibacterium luteifluviistationis]AWV98527.1 cytochrome C [Arcticibacterium luteifluviistationis]